MFARWGRFVYRFKWATLAGSGVLLAITVAGLLMGGNLQQGGPTVTNNIEAFKANNLINTELSRGGRTFVSSNFSLIFRSDSLAVSDPAFKEAVKAALAPIASDPRITSIASPFDETNTQAAQALTSKDGHEALVSIELKSAGKQAWADYNDLRGKVMSDKLSITGTGFLPINQAFNSTLENDLQRAEYVSVPITLLLLILIFATVVAAGLPLGVGMLTIVGGLGATFFLNRFTDVSQYALNIVTLIGLGVSIDYSLFIVNRFRDELARGESRQDAIATTMATAGRAITFSGLTVAVGLSAMLFFQGTFMASMGAAGAIVVAVAVLYGLTFLPAMLSILGPRVNWKPISRVAQTIVWSLAAVSFLLAALALAAYWLKVAPSGLSNAAFVGGLVFLLLAVIFALIAIGGLMARRPPAAREGEFWSGLATWVMKRPVVVLVPTVAFLVIVATPYFSLRMANGDVDMLPLRLEARQGYDRLIADFPGRNQTTFSMVLNYPDGAPLTTSRIADQIAYEKRIAAIPGLLNTFSIYDLDPKLTVADYQAMYTGDPSKLPAHARQLVQAEVGNHIVLMSAISSAQPTSDEARTILKAIRADQGPGSGAQVFVDGATAIDVDVINFIIDRTPLAVVVVVLITYLLLFLQTGSVVLPLKAVILNFLSIGASFGALVFIFQQGHFSSLFGFTPQSIDPSIPVILFSIVFGLSMDYEVLLVSRIHEEYVRTGDNTAAVAMGLERSGRLITGAAGIMFAVFMAFGLAEVVIIKAIGIGLAIAVAIDATIVRSLVVPAVMRLLGDWNWWAPRPLRWLHSKAGLSDLGVEEPAVLIEPKSAPGVAQQA